MLVLVLDLRMVVAEVSGSAGAVAQLVVVVLVLVLDLRMVVAEVSGTCCLPPGMRRNTHLCMYA